MAIIPAVDGGQLLADLDPRTVGFKNCLRRINVRRVDDAEMLMPGWDKYGPTLSKAVTHVARAVRPNGERAILAFTSTEIYHLSGSSWVLLADGFTEATYWEAVSINGYVVFNNGEDLPRVWDWETVTPMYELREQGVVRVGTIYNAFNFLVMADVTEIISERLKDVMTGPDPYGYVDPANTTNTGYRVMWSDDPTRWKLGVKAEVREDAIIIDYPCASLKAGDKINFIETLEDGDDTTAILTKVEITEVDGRRIYVGDTTLVPSTGFLTRSNYSEQIVGYDDLQGDGSRVLHMNMLSGTLVLYRDGSIAVGQLSASIDAPIAFTEVYSGLAAPTAKRLITKADPRSVIYYSREGWFTFNLTTRIPERVRAFDYNDDLFSGLDEELSFTVHLPNDDEFWIFSTDRTLVYNYSQGIFSELDVAFTAAGLVDDPEDVTGGADRMLLLSDAEGVKKFDDQTFTRAGEEYEGVIEYGWLSEPKMRDICTRRYSFVGQGNIEATINKMYSGDTPAKEVVTKALNAGVSLSLYTRSQYFNDVIRITDGATKVVARELDYYSVANRNRGFR